jgi:hypothetical protein
MKQVYNFTDAPTYSKILPFLGLAAGVSLAVYQKKDCVGCYLGYGLSGMLLASIPLALEAKKAATPQMLNDCGCGGK